MKITDYVTKEEMKLLMEEAKKFTLLKQQRKVLCRVLPFLDTDTPEETLRKFDTHTNWKYLGNLGELLFIRYIEKEIGHTIEHNILYKTKKGNIGDIDTITKTGLKGDIKTSNNEIMNINKKDLMVNDIFIKVRVNTNKNEFNILGFITKKDIYRRVRPNGDVYYVYYKTLNHNLEELKKYYV